MGGGVGAGGSAATALAASRLRGIQPQWADLMDMQGDFLRRRRDGGEAQQGPPRDDDNARAATARTLAGGVDVVSKTRSRTPTQWFANDARRERRQL